MKDNAIEIQGISKQYKKTKEHKAHLALDDISLTIQTGIIHGLLGPNGAGKSTLINILAGLVYKTKGSVKIMGCDLDDDLQACKSALGVVPQELNVDPFFTPRQILDLHAGLFGVRKKDRRTDEILELLHLTDKADSSSQGLSGGMRRRLMVAKAMVHNPPILILDEPTAGVDVELRQTLWKSIRKLNKEGTTVLLTTHYLEEAESMCEKITILNHGKIVANESTKMLISGLDNKILSIQLSHKIDAIPENLADYNTQLKDNEDKSQSLIIRYKPSEKKVADILEKLLSSKIPISDINTEEADLEDIFLQLTK